MTPLTDRCVLTLLTAKFLNRGGNPLGPAGNISCVCPDSVRVSGTGKTETVKDLSKNLAMCGLLVAWFRITEALIGTVW